MTKVNEYIKNLGNSIYYNPIPKDTIEGKSIIKNSKVYRVSPYVNSTYTAPDGYSYCLLYPLGIRERKRKYLYFPLAWGTNFLNCEGEGHIRNKTIRVGNHKKEILEIITPEKFLELYNKVESLIELTN